MGKVRVCFDRTGDTLTVWLDDPKKEHICEELDDDIILMKDRRERVIGFERLNLTSRTAGTPRWKGKLSSGGRKEGS